MRNNWSSDGLIQIKFIILNKTEIFNAFERPLNIFCLAVPFASIFFYTINNTNLDEGREIKI